MYTLKIDKDKFLNQYWQKRPIVLKQAFEEFVDFIDANELAGLAMEEHISSRIVITVDNQDKPASWQVIQGPFEDYQQYGETHWQLLVQAVNHWHPDANQLVKAFRFLPDWRFDDLMTSFATPYGGVGPHIDNYDVFIIQGSGKRRWKVGEMGEYQPRDGNATTPLIDDFVPIIDTTLEAGDILYIPPGFPHRGETIETALSYSVGFRAPSQQELLSEVADYYLDNNQGLQRFTSKSESQSPELVTMEEQQDLLKMLTAITADQQNYQTMLGRILSQNRFELNIETTDPISTNELLEALEQGAIILRVGGVKILRLEGDVNPRLFVNGDVIDAPGCDELMLNTISQSFQFSNAVLLEVCYKPSHINLLIQLVDQGYLYLSDAS